MDRLPMSVTPGEYVEVWLSENWGSYYGELTHVPRGEGDCYSLLVAKSNSVIHFQRFFLMERKEG